MKQMHNNRPFGLRVQSDVIIPREIGETHHLNPLANPKKPSRAKQMDLVYTRRNQWELWLSSNGFKWDIANGMRGKRRDFLPGLQYHLLFIHFLDTCEYVFEINDVPDIIVPSRKPVYGLQLEGTPAYVKLDQGHFGHRG